MRLFTPPKSAYWGLLCAFTLCLFGEGAAAVALSPAVQSERDYASYGRDIDGDARLTRLRAFSPERLAIWQRAAAAGDPYGAFLAGRCAEHGIHQPADLEVARRLYTVGARADFAAAQWNLAALYHHGRGGAVDTARALKLYQRAAEQLPIARFYLGTLYQKGELVQRDLHRAIRAFEESAPRVPRAALRLATLLIRGPAEFRDPRRGRAFLERASAMGLALADYNLGIYHLRAFGGLRDERMALKAFERGHRRGHGPSSCLLGRIYRAGRVVPRDLVRAEALFQLSIERGDQRCAQGLERLIAQRQALAIRGSLAQSGEVAQSRHIRRTKGRRSRDRSLTMLALLLALTALLAAQTRPAPLARS